MIGGGDRRIKKEIWKEVECEREQWWCNCSPEEFWEAALKSLRGLVITVIKGQRNANSKPDQSVACPLRYYTLSWAEMIRDEPEFIYFGSVPGFRNQAGVFGQPGLLLEMLLKLQRGGCCECIICTWHFNCSLFSASLWNNFSTASTQASLPVVLIPVFWQRFCHRAPTALYPKWNEPIFARKRAAKCDDDPADGYLQLGCCWGQWPRKWDAIIQGLLSREMTHKEEEGDCWSLIHTHIHTHRWTWASRLHF